MSEHHNSHSQAETNEATAADEISGATPQGSTGEVVAEDLKDQPVEEQLEKILKEAEESISSLREELAEQRRMHELHQEIERLPEHLANTTVKWGGVRDFFRELVSELRNNRMKKKEQDNA